jgi:hypothetical protein
MKIKPTVFINNFNRLQWVRQMCAVLTSWDTCEIVIVDNASGYPPLLKWYQVCPFEVIRLDSNMGHRATWESGAVGAVAGSHYVVTDPDLDLAWTPPDAIDKLRKGLDNRSDCQKCGLSLEILDLPPRFRNLDEVVRWESQYWECDKDSGFFAAPVDTTFALYEVGRPLDWNLPNCLRADRPYTAKHIPWYATPEALNDEMRFYIATSSTSTHWTSVSQRG